MSTTAAHNLRPNPYEVGSWEWLNEQARRAEMDRAIARRNRRSAR